jgi:hypothetical protein
MQRIMRPFRVEFLTCLVRCVINLLSPRTNLERIYRTGSLTYEAQIRVLQ